MSEDSKQRLFQLRLRLNESRKANHKAVVDEHRREMRPAPAKGDDSATPEERERWSEQRRKRRLKAEVKSGKRPKDVMSMSAEDAESFYDDYLKPKHQVSGQEIHTESFQFNRYFKKSKGATVAKPLPQGEDDVNRLATAMERESSKSFSRRRRFVDDADVNYISEKNRQYNEKLDRAYQKETEEIRLNLERGTAI